MGTSGEDKPLSGLVGTNTTYLIDDAAVPVLIVPEETGYRPPNRLCYATDLQHLDPFSISDVFDLFGPFEPVVDFAHVATSENEKTEFNLSLLRKAIDRPEIHDRLDFTSLYGEDGEETLLWHTRLSNADLLVMNRPHRGWLERLWRRSFTKNVMLKAELPLLILHGREREG
jgi:nucleotide-binding universal stress UspA family protein